MNREKALLDIREMLARFKAEVEIANEASLYDVNIIAESALIPFLNAVYDLNLMNINLIEKNFPAVDLVDEANRVAIQVTSTSDRDKIIHTLTQFRDKRLDGKFDKLYIYILTDKKEYSKDFKEYLPFGFSFDKETDIIDSATVYNKITGLNLYRVDGIADLLKEAFSEKKIEIRKRTVAKERVKREEVLILNMVEIVLPYKIFSAEINIDRESLKSKIPYRKRYRFFEKEMVIAALREKSITTKLDWTIHKGRIYCFRNLYEENEQLKKIIDSGTIETDNTIDFAILSVNHENILKGLIRFVMIEQFATLGIEWLERDGIFRFKVQGLPKSTSVTWKKEVKNAPREVISEHWNQENTHIIAFRHLAFKYNIYRFSEKWYLSIIPTWTFTFDGKRKSRFSKDLVTGLKKLENNQSVNGHFLFLIDYVKDKAVLGLIERESRYINILEPQIFNFSPIVEEDIWNPAKPKVKTSKTESNQNSLFDNDN